MERLGKYEIVSELGRGGMGVVYKARDPFLNRLIALKTIATGALGRPDLLERFLQEARSAGTLQHPNIVTIYELGDFGKSPYIAMEFIEGSTLESIITRRTPVPLPVKLGLILQVSSGLQYAHEHGVIHRDVKPGNIMVNASGVAKLVDFGIARVIDASMTQTNLVLGSRAYMAPELYSGERADVRTDIWALGVTLFEFLTYQKPFHAETEAAIMFKVLHSEVPLACHFCPDCPAAVEGVLKRMLEKDAASRFQSVEEAAEELGPIWRQLQRESVQLLLPQARASLEVGNLVGAREIVGRALQIDGSDMAAKRLLDEISLEIRRVDVLPRPQERLNQAERHLKAGKLVEARADVEAAMAMDARNEGARTLLAQIQEAEKLREALSQDLRITKQRIVEGALTEAYGLADRVLKSYPGDSAAADLKKQIESEQKRRDRRKLLMAAKEKARELWMESKYADCVAYLNEEITRFPGDPDLLKLRETAEQDLLENEKQSQLTLARKLLGQHQFREALGVLEQLEREFPRDAAVTTLREFARQGESERNKHQHLAAAVTELRGLIRQEKYAEAAARGAVFLRDLPHDHELQELVGYARGETTQRQLTSKENDLTRRIAELLGVNKYAEAAAAAREAVREFPRLKKFKTLFEDAERKRKEQVNRDEYQRRILEIQRRITRQELTDAIDMAQQTLATMGPSPQVSQLLEAAKIEQEERTQRIQQRLESAETLIAGGRIDDATELLNDAFATKILPRSHPGAKKLLDRMSRISKAPRSRPVPMTPESRRGGAPPDSAAFALSSDSADSSGTHVLNLTPPPAGTPAPAGNDAVAEANARGGDPNIAASASADSAQVRRARTAPRVTARKDLDFRVFLAEVTRLALTIGEQLGSAASGLAAKVKAQTPALFTPAFNKRAVMTGAATIVILVVAIGSVALWRRYRNSRNEFSSESQLREQAERAWTRHDPNQAEDKWKQLQALHGRLEEKATQEISYIEGQRVGEQQLFDDGMRLVQADPADPHGLEELSKVAALQLWHAVAAQSTLDNLKQLAQSAKDVSDKEQELFDRGQQLFNAKNYDSARRQFLELLKLQVPNSALRPKALEYLGKLRALNDDQRNYGVALQDLHNEDWEAARGGFAAVANHRGALKDDAQKQLDKLASIEGSLRDAEDLIHSHSYRGAKSKVDAMQPFPATYSRLRAELNNTEEQEFSAIKARATTMEQTQDTTGLERLQAELDSLTVRVADDSLLSATQDFSQKLSSEISQLKKEQSSDKDSFDKAEHDFQQARSEGDINRLKNEITTEFRQIAQGNGYNRVGAQGYVGTVIPDTVRELTQGQAKKGRAILPPISCDLRPSETLTLQSSAHTAACGSLDAESPLRWVGNPAIDFPANAKSAGKLPYTLHLIVVVNEAGNVIHVEKDGLADADFLKKAKEAAKQWRTTAPRRNGKPINAAFPIVVTFQP